MKTFSKLQIIYNQGNVKLHESFPLKHTVYQTHQNDSVTVTVASGQGKLLLTSSPGYVMCKQLQG